MILFYDGPKPSDGLYDDFLNLPNSAESIIQDDFAKFMSRLAISPLDR